MLQQVKFSQYREAQVPVRMKEKHDASRKIQKINAAKSKEKLKGQHNASVSQALSRGRRVRKKKLLMTRIQPRICSVTKISGFASKLQHLHGRRRKGTIENLQSLGKAQNMSLENVILAIKSCEIYFNVWA